MTSPRYGFELPLLLAGSFQQIINQLHRHLAERGHDGARPVHGFALQFVGPQGVTVTALGRRLGVSKQACGKTVGVMERLGYVTRTPHPSDARAALVHRTAHGTELLALSAAFFETQKGEWQKRIGADRFEALLADLDELSEGTAMTGFPGLLS